MFSMLAPFLPESLRLGNTFQNLRVSSPAPVTIVLPSGLMARYSTRKVWPVRVLIFYILGYFQMLISFWEYPWVLTISFSVFENIKLQTWDPASTVLIVAPVRVFLKRIVRSAVPPPETNNPCWWGDQAIAFTAATWSQNFITGSVLWGVHRSNLLSLPPEQSCCSSNDHLSPQTSCLCPISLLMKGLLLLKSLWRMVLSREPVLRMEEFHAIDPTRFEWPCMILILFILFTSQIWTSPELVPIEKWGPFKLQETDVTVSAIPKSHSLVTLELLAFQRYTLDDSPTAK